MDPKLVVQNFLETLTQLSNSKTTLLFRRSGANTLSLPDATETFEATELSEKAQGEEVFDFIALDLPIGMKNTKRIEVGGNSLKVQSTWGDIASALCLLTDYGYCAALVEPMAFSTSSGNGESFVAALERDGLFLAGLFNAPPKTYSSSSFRPVIAVFSRQKSRGVFFGELNDPDQVSGLASAFIKGWESNSLETGMLRESHVFKGFNRLKAHIQLNRLETQYKDYATVPLGDLAVEVRLPRSGDTLEEKANSVYIPKLGTSPVACSLSGVRIKHHNVFQVVLSDKVSNSYVAAFFQSEIGKLVLETLNAGSYIPNITKTALLDAPIALPPREEQEEIVATHDLLGQISTAILDIQKELAINPKNASLIRPQAIEILGQMGALSEADRIKSLIRQGESKKLEFKESLSLDVRKGTKEKYIEESALKTVAAFLNTEGGVLFVGVSDSGDLKGIDSEIAKFHKLHIPAHRDRPFRLNVTARSG
ncbi:MAG: RNA-binding domain-containing protein [Marinobacter sp.]|uniref:ATP-binding protein n=1 Tax=Marinobacter sp. TaxID=50741 RepID=UPI0032968B76